MKSFVVAVGFLLLALPALAQQDGAGKGRHEGCKAKVEALCPGVQPGGGRLKACLQQQGKTLADVCPEAAAKRAQQQSNTGAPAAMPANPSSPPVGSNTSPGGFPSQAPVAQQPGSDNQ